MTKARHFNTREVSVPQWQLPTRRPKILIAQLQTAYHPRADVPRRVRVRADSDYVTRMIAAVREMKNQRANFLLFPEYACPFSARDVLLGALTKELPVMGVCVLPFEHLTHEEFREVGDVFPVEKRHLKQVREDIARSVERSERPHAIVNVAAVVIKTKTKVHAFLQSKTSAAGLEEYAVLGAPLAVGRTRYIFRGVDIRIAVEICFDVVARDSAHDERPRDALAEMGPDILFVPECNPKPFHESYARAIVDMYEEPRWASERTVVVFANVARGSTLGLDEEFFGFSRCVGGLGRVAPTTRAFLVREGIVAHAKPTSLSDLERHAEFIATQNFKWLIARREQSLVALEIPTLGTGPSRDPSAGRFDTATGLSRWASGTNGRWHTVRETFAPPVATPQLGVPEELHTRLFGAADARAKFREQLAKARLPLWVFGEGGVGKTALVANCLREGCGFGARVVWLDMAIVNRGSAALAESLLLRLGKEGAMEQPVAEQWAVVKDEVRRAPTVVVLDSFERWSEPQLPNELLELHGWPSRVVVTARHEGDAQIVESFEVPPLDAGAQREFFSSVVGATPFEGALGGKPLAYVWLAGLHRQDPSALERLRRSLGQADTVEHIFERCVVTLDATERAVLTLLTTLPAPLAVDDLVALVGKKLGEVKAAIERLRTTNLTTRSSSDGGAPQAQHPFVSQFWRRHVTAAEQSQANASLVKWCAETLTRYGGDGKAPYAELRRRWRNVAFVLDGLEKREPCRFVELARLADYFLWSEGRLRERLDLGRRVATAARSVGDDVALAFALYDSIAETMWHLGAAINDCNRLLDDAAKIYESRSDARGRASVEYYRGRLFRHANDFQSAQTRALNAVKLAKRSGDPWLRGLAQHGLANVHRSRGEIGKAQWWYRHAAALLREANDKEMLAVVERNLGRCAIYRSDHAEALDHFDAAIKQFHALELPVEEAEAAMYRADALRKLGEGAEAEDDLAALRRYFESIGSARAREVDRLLAAPT